jgi:hypothetical protein
MMDNKPFGTNGNSNIGVSGPTRPNIDPTHGAALEDDFSELRYVDVEGSAPWDGEKEKSVSARRRKLVRGFLVLAALALVVIGSFFWMAGGNKKKIDLAVRDRSAQAEQPTSQKIDDVTAQAIAEIRNGAGASPAPSPIVTDPSAKTGAVRDTTPVTIPLGGTVGTVEGAPAPSAPGASSAGDTARSAETASRRNSERSIRCAQVLKPGAILLPKQPATPDFARSPAGAIPALLTAAEKPVTLPPFGALLPVRTLGAIYTLRPSLSRFELTRDLRGDGWMMKKGTILVGQQQGSELDRAYVSLTGFIDPNSGKFVKLAGDTLGADGAPGLRGKRRRLGSRWARVLSRTASAAVTLGQAALSRGGTIVNISGAVTPEVQGFSSNVVNAREFVEVPAGAAAFVLITSLPKEIRGVDPQPPMADKGGAPLGDDELANLLTGGSSDEIRAAIPRMTPELRHVAEAVLKESSNSDAAEGSGQRKR